MSEQRSRPNRRTAQALWWSGAAIIVCVVATLVWGGLYAGRRTWALQQLGPMTSVVIHPPGIVPRALESRVPTWAHEIREVDGHSRSDWQALAAFPEVQVVQFWEAGLTDADLQLLPRMRKLISLNLGHQPGITDAGVANLERLPHLSEVTLYESQIGDAGLQSIARIPALQVLSIELTHATGAGLSALQEAGHLRSLDIVIEAGSAISLEDLEKAESLEELALYGSGVAGAMRSLRLPPHVRSIEFGSDLNDAQVDNIPELLAAVPGIERVQTLEFDHSLLSTITIEKICERLGMVEKSKIFRRRSLQD